LRIISTVLLIFMVIYNSNFYGKPGVYLYIVCYYYLVASNVVQNYLLNGFDRIYYSLVMTLEIVLIYISATNCG
jgi:hypothetical protein